MMNPLGTIILLRIINNKLLILGYRLINHLCLVSNSRDGLKVSEIAELA